MSEGNMLTLTVNIDGIRRKLTTLAKTAKDIEPALKVFDRYYRARVDQRFGSEGPGWAPRAESTQVQHDHRQKQAQALAEHRLKRKLTSELKRAVRRQRLGKGTVAAVERRYQVLKEFERQLAGGMVGRQVGGDRRLEKSVAGLRDRRARAEAKVAGRVLGRIATSMTSKIS